LRSRCDSARQQKNVSVPTAHPECHQALRVILFSATSSLGKNFPGAKSKRALRQPPENSNEVASWHGDENLTSHRQMRHETHEGKYCFCLPVSSRFQRVFPEKFVSRFRR
jgi:hypothetical protein